MGASGLAAAILLLSSAAIAQTPPAPPAAAKPVAAPAAPKPVPPPEPPSTVNAHYVEPSAETPIAPGDKISHLFARNSSAPYVLQKLTKRSYWVQSHNYQALFYVGDKGVLLLDAPEGTGDAVLKAIAEVTKLPVTALVYSHNHADHIADAHVLIDAAAKTKTKLRIIASKATAEKMAFLKSNHPKPTETVAWPRGTFKFEGLTVELHGFVHAAHADDHAAWLLRGEKIVHLPDLVNPDQPPFWGWAVAESFVYYPTDLEELGKLDWDYLSSGHGNIGAKADIEFYRTFIADTKAAVGKALSEVKFGDGVDLSKVNSHAVFLVTFMANVSRKATETMRGKYGKLYGFEDSMPRNAELVALSMFSYR